MTLLDLLMTLEQLMPERAIYFSYMTAPSMVSTTTTTWTYYLRIGLEVYVRTRIVAFLEPMRLFFCADLPLRMQKIRLRSSSPASDCEQP